MAFATYRLLAPGDTNGRVDTYVKDLATGGPTSLHDTMLALEKADLSFRLMMQDRNKIVEAYQEIVRMQV